MYQHEGKSVKCGEDPPSVAITTYNYVYPRQKVEDRFGNFEIVPSLQAEHRSVSLSSKRGGMFVLELVYHIFHGTVKSSRRSETFSSAGQSNILLRMIKMLSDKRKGMILRSVHQTHTGSRSGQP